MRRPRIDQRYPMTKETTEGGVEKSARRVSSRKAKTAAGHGAKASKAPIAEAETGRDVTTEERWKMIAEAAYYHAEKRGFGGDPTDDWRAAEADIDAKLAKKGS